jgi:hypothetical protein
MVVKTIENNLLTIFRSGNTFLDNTEQANIPEILNFNFF